MEAAALDRLPEGAPGRWPGAAPLPEDDRRIEVDVEVPPTFVAGETVVLECRLRNTTRVPIASLEPNPISLGFVWGGIDETEQGRAMLPWLIWPGEKIELNLVVTAPNAPGNHSLTVAAVQEHIAWLGGGFEGIVEVVAAE